MSTATFTNNATTPSTPTAGKSVLYLDVTGTLRLLDSTGTASVVGGAGASGPVASTSYMWVDTAHVGVEAGTEAEPFSTIQAAIDAAAAAEVTTVVIKSPGPSASYAVAESFTLSGKSAVFRTQGRVFLTGTITVEATGSASAAAWFDGFSSLHAIVLGDNGSSANQASVGVRGEAASRPTGVSSITETRASGASLIVLERAQVGPIAANNTDSGLLYAWECSMGALTVFTLGCLKDCIITGAVSYRKLSAVWAASVAGMGGASGLWGHSQLGRPGLPVTVTYAGTSPSASDYEFLPCSAEALEHIRALEDAGTAVTFVACALLPVRPNTDEVFGDGSDGVVTLGAGTTTVSRPMYYEDLTIPSGATLRLRGNPVFVRGRLTVEGEVFADAVDATTQAGSRGGSEREFTILINANALLLPPGEVGHDGGTSLSENGEGKTGTSATCRWGGTGGDGGDHASAGAGGAGSVFTVIPARTWKHLLSPPPVMDAGGVLRRFVAGAGGAGGGGESGVGSGGGGGGGGGSILLVSRRTVIDVVASITARGGAGAAGVDADCGGGGGGGGGAVMLVTDAVVGDFLAAVDVSGGAGGAGNGAGAAGAAGAAGYSQVTLLGGR